MCVYIQHICCIKDCCHLPLPCWTGTHDLIQVHDHAGNVLSKQHVDIDDIDGGIEGALLIEAWNKKHPQHTVERGDFIVEINGSPMTEERLGTIICKYQSFVDWTQLSFWQS